MVATTAAAPARERLADSVMELVGLAALVGFAYAVWPPLALLLAGLVLVVAANVRDARRARAAAARPGRQVGRPAAASRSRRRAPSRLRAACRAAVAAYRTPGGG